jgi:hypothetical protein
VVATHLIVGCRVRSTLFVVFTTMRGRQWRCQFQEEHVFKEVMAELIVERVIRQAISIHSMRAGKFNDYVDDRAYTSCWESARIRSQNPSGGRADRGDRRTLRPWDRHERVVR